MKEIKVDWKPAPRLEQMFVCDICGSVISVHYLATHAVWHDRIEGEDVYG